MFRSMNNAIYVDTYALDVFLPYDYLSKSYRGYDYYSLVGSKVRFFAVGNMRAYKTKKEMDDPLSVQTYPLGIPLQITSCPSEIDTRDVRFTKGGPIRRCIVLTYYKDDVFMESQDCIKNHSNVMIVLARQEGGKLDHFPPDAAIELLQDAQSMNNIKLRIPSEAEEIFVAERYRNPANPNQKARFADNMNPDKVVTYNMRQESMQTSTYQALTNEDINTSLIVSVNRKNDGVVDDPTLMEMIVRGMDMSDVIDERDKRLATESDG